MPIVNDLLQSLKQSEHLCSRLLEIPFIQNTDGTYTVPQEHITILNQLETLHLGRGSLITQLEG